VCQLNAPAQFCRAVLSFSLRSESDPSERPHSAGMHCRALFAVRVCLHDLPDLIDRVVCKVIAITGAATLEVHTACIEAGMNQ
jgi:hypothetical protein